MASSMRIVSGSCGVVGACSSSSWVGKNRRRGMARKVQCVSSSYYSAPSSSSSSGLMDQYKTLRIEPGASETDVKRAFRKLALQYHPDVCKGSNCGIQFHQINEAYDLVMNSLRATEEDLESNMQEWGEDDDQQMRGMYDSSWDLWEEWMGFEGACTTDYSAHINPYI